MTVCIAAACKDGDEKKIVLCTDRKISSSLGSAETSGKVISLKHGWRCLTAGTEADILALVRLYKFQFLDRDNLAPHAIDASIREPLHRRKKQLADEYIRRRFAMSHDDFMANGKDRLPPEFFYDAAQTIGQIEIDAELIICGFIENEAQIYHTDTKGVARAASHFAVVGEGEYLASAALLRREQNGWLSLENTLYNVFEAKRLSESVGSVGQTTYLAVVDSGGRLKLTSLDVDEQLKEWFGKYGPQSVPSDVKFTGDYYYTRDKVVTP